MTQPTEKTLSWPMRHQVAVNLTPEDMGVLEAALNDCESKSDDDTVDALAQIILVLEIADIPLGGTSSGIFLPGLFLIGGA